MSKLKLLFLRLFIFLGVVAIGFIAFSGYKEIKKKRAVQATIESLQEEVARIDKENSATAQKIAYLESSDYKEREAKDKLNLKSPDENVVVIKPSSSQKITLNEDVSSRNTPQIRIENSYALSNPQKWWNYFFKY